MNAAFQRLKIISGGQTGVDRAVLAVGLVLGLPVGGGCPQGRRAEDGRVMGANCRLPLDWTEDVNHHMDPSILKKCMINHDLIDVWRSGVWLSTAEIHELTGIPSDKIKNAFNRGKLQYKMILGRRYATYADVLAWAHSGK